MFDGFEMLPEESVASFEGIAKFGAAEGKAQPLKEAGGKSLWSRELYKGLGVLISLGQTARAAPSPLS